LDKDKIENGDKVKFIFSNRSSFFAKVVSVPIQSGECWIVKKIENKVAKEIIYVKDFEYITLIKKHEPEEKNKNDSL